LGKFRSAFDWKVCVHFMSICNILRTLGISNDRLVHFVFM
jgi:hypothetical protein